MPAKKILILSASFGEGHNSAANNVREALTQLAPDCETKVCDLFKYGAEQYEVFFNWGYQFLTNRMPRIWSRLYNSVDRADHTKMGRIWARGLHRKLTMLLAREKPDALVYTYPLYPHLMSWGHPGIPLPRRTFLVITDSITINRVWHSAPSDYFFVTDALTKKIIEDRGVPGDRIFDTGFAVAPIFGELPLREETQKIERLLYFATTGNRHVETTLRSLLQDTPQELRITVVMGRHEKRLGQRVRQWAARHPNRSVETLGWTREVPRLLTTHDLVITKAGGATVHECLAAGTPPIINYVIPGQEEGNAQLVEKLGCGWRDNNPKGIGLRIRGLIESGQWRQAKHNAMQQRKPDGAMAAARIILDKIDNPSA